MIGHVMGFTVSALRFGASAAVLCFLAGLPLQAQAQHRTLGQDCSTNTQCGSGRCDAAAGNPRKCIPNDRTGRIGDYCSHHDHCGTRLCVGDQCSAIGTLAEGAACSANAACQSGRCDAAPGNPRRCIPNDGTGRVGDYCSHHNHCTSRYCLNSRCGATATIALGAACTHNFECGSGRCDAAAEVPRACIPNDNTGQPGNYCTHDNQCSGRLLCLNQSGHNVFFTPQRGSCGPPNRELGEGCFIGSPTPIRELSVQTHKNPCKSGRCDWNDPYKCIPNDGTGQVGNYCTHNNHCASKLCVRDHCIAGGATQLGQSCSTNTQCISGRCDAAPGHPRRCIPNDGTGRSGDYCTHNNHCLGGSRCVLNAGAVYGTCRR